MQSNEREQAGWQQGVAGRRVTWFGPERPVGGGTVAIRSVAEPGSAAEEADVGFGDAGRGPVPH